MIEEELIKSFECAQRDYSFPKDIWRPDFGWILRDGNPTEMTEDFNKWVQSIPKEVT
jgi:hypothetical protein